MPERQPVVLERLLNAPIERVCSALTNKEEMKKWYFDLAAFEPQEGFEFRFTGGPSPEKQYEHVCVVTEVNAPRKLTYSWRYAGYEGISHVTFELFSEGARTKLVLTHSGLESFPQSNEDFARKNFEAGWDEIINRSLATYLAG